MSLEKIQEVEEIVSMMMDSTIESLKRDLSTIHAGPCMNSAEVTFQTFNRAVHHHGNYFLDFLYFFQ